LQSGGNIQKSLASLIIGALFGAVSGFNPWSAAGSGFGTQFFTQLLNGASIFDALKRAAVSGLIAGAGSGLALSFGEVKNASLTIALMAIDGDLIVDAVAAFGGI
jgi:hypothetical protein